MRKRIMGIILAVSTVFALTPETVMAARIEVEPIPLLETAKPAEMETTEAKPESEVRTAGGVSGMEGDGTKTAPYRIGNAEQLRAFADLVNGAGGAPVTEACASLVQDIDLSGVCGPEIGSWTPIGTGRKVM